MRHGEKKCLVNSALQTFFIHFCNIFTASETSPFLIFLHPLYHFSLFHIGHRANELLNFLKLLQGALASLHCLLVLVSWRRILHKNTSGNIPSGNPLAKFLQETLLRSSFRKNPAILFQENLFLRR